MSIYTLSAVQLDGGPDLMFDQVTSQSIDTGTTKETVHRSGGVDPIIVAIMEQKPKFTFSTNQVGKALAGCGVDGVAIGAGLTYTACNLFFKRRAAGGQYIANATASHIKIGVAMGMLIPRTLRASQGGVASVEFTLCMASNGANSPFVHTFGVALEPPATNATEMFTIGPAYVGGASLELPSLTDVSVDFGIQEGESPLGSGTIWPQMVFIQKRQPMIRLTSIDPDGVKTILGTISPGAGDALGLSVNGTATSGLRLFLRKKSPGGANYANDSTQHLVLRCSVGHIGWTSIQADEHGDAKVEMEMQPINDGVNSYMTVTNGTDIGAGI